MSGVHKYPTISFRVSDREREMIEAKILASGMQKKDYFVRSCIYNRICVVGKKGSMTGLMGQDNGKDGLRIIVECGKISIVLGSIT